MARRTNKPPEYKSYRTVAELADFLGVSERTIERWYREDIMPIPFRLPDGTKIWSPQQCQVILSVRKADLARKERRITKTRRHG